MHAPINMAFTRHAAEVLERVAPDLAPELSSDLMANATALYRLPELIDPASQTFGLRQSYLDLLARQRSLYAFLSGDSELQPYTQEFLVEEEIDAVDVEPMLRSLGISRGPYFASFGSECSAIARQFSLVIEQVENIPTLNTKT